jgi:hypothetical protein
MRRRHILVLMGLAILSAASLRAQEGHPLTGTWSGDWGVGAAKRTHITLVMAWDGTSISGTINPGPDAIAIPAIALDVTTWTIRFEADTKDGRLAAEGRIDDIASAHRTISGTWRQGTAKGDFKLTRD